MTTGRTPNQGKGSSRPTGPFPLWAGAAIVILVAAVIVLLGLLYMINRPYFMQFFNPETRTCGIPLLVLSGLMVGSGFYVTQRIVDIDI